MVIEERLLPQDAVLAEIHYAIGLGRKREFLIRAGKPQGASVPDEVDLAVRLDENVVPAPLPTHATASMSMGCIKCSRDERRRSPRAGESRNHCDSRTFSAMETPSRRGTIAAIIRGSLPSRSL